METTTYETLKSAYEPVVSHLRECEFSGDGWRKFFSYRDLGLTTATQGEYAMRVVRAQSGAAVSTGWHHHVLNAQIIYCLNGWEAIALEDGRVIKLIRDTCLNIPPGFLHNEIGYSADLEMLVITNPADVKTIAAEAPSGWDDARMQAELAWQISGEQLFAPWSWQAANSGS